MARHTHQDIRARQVFLVERRDRCAARPENLDPPTRHSRRLGNFLRTLATAEPIKDWSLTSLKEKLIKIDRGEGHQPRPLCRLPDGRGRHSEKSVRRHPAADRRTAAATSSCVGVRRLVVVCSKTMGERCFDRIQFVIFPVRRRARWFAERSSRTTTMDQRPSDLPNRPN
jgi:hypothetical protein